MSDEIEMNNASPNTSFLGGEIYENGKNWKGKNCDSRSQSLGSREIWTNKAQSFCTVLGAIIGMGNLWRFPYICYESGGGAFLLPYGFCVAFIGFPLFFLETALGQYTRLGTIGAWDIVPIMKGVGIGSAVLVTYSSIYFIVIIAWGFFYFFHSFTTGDLPFTTCGNWWNTNSCRPYDYIFENKSYDVMYFNDTSTQISLNTSSLPYDDLAQENRTLPIAEFWDRYVLRQSNGLEDYGTLENWMMTVCLVIAWITCFLCIIKGIKSAGRVALFTATFPYVLLVIILVRGCTLPGAVDGIYYYLKPNISKLAEAQVWVQAGGQVCYSYAIGFAFLITMGSYNEFHKDCYKHCMVLVGSCAGTSFVTGFAVFSIIGNLAYVTNRNVSEVVDSGPGLVFQAFPTALSLLPLPQLWNALFFFMLILIGLDSQFACVETIIVLITDHWPKYFSRKNRKEILRLATCSIMLLIGLVFIPAGGVYVFELFNNYAVSGIAVLWIAMMEAVAISYVYGIDKFYKNIQEMIGYRPSPFLKISLLAVTPLLTLGIMIFHIVKYEPLKENGYTYSPWAQGVGWVMCLSSLLCVPAVFLHSLWKAEGSLKERWLEATISRIATDNDSDQTISTGSDKLIVKSVKKGSF